VRWKKAQSRKKILQTPSATLDQHSNIEIHALTCENDYTDLLWTLKTFIHFTDRQCYVVIHDDGSLSNEATRNITKHLPGVSVIAKAQADKTMSARLQDYKACQRFRATNPLALKIFDFPAFAKNDHFLVLDSDVLFFKRPEEILTSIKRNRLFFMSDYQDSYIVSRDEIRKRYCRQIPHAFNTGISFLSKSLEDLSFIEKYCEDLEKENLLQHSWSEQTLWALLLSRLPDVADRLPETYSISSQPIDSKTISHHFVNDGSRGFFYTRGIEHLQQTGFPQQCVKRVSI
jgi:hypothetical protein